MRISTEWLQEYVDLPAPDELAQIFEMAGAGVEERATMDDGEVFTLEITSNRGDWLSVVGLAREVAAMTATRLRLPSALEIIETEVAERVQVEIENPEDCPRYVARLVENVCVGASPDWMQKRLLACGMRPVNNVVDITNYVMLETGQPLHAFDADKISNHIVVRRAQNGETITTLDDVERQLDENTLVIADGSTAPRSSTPIAVAGVMGGANSEVSQNTTRILLESAHFSPARVRQSARVLRLQTEASRRFVRWVDPNGALRAANRAAQLLVEYANASIATGATDRHLAPAREAKVAMRAARCNALLGISLSKTRMMELLEQLGFSVEETGDALEVSIPTWRRDIELEADLIEEIARVNGYESVPTTLPRGATAGAGRSLSQRLEENARTILLRCGLNEVVTYSLQNAAAVERAGLSASLFGEPVRLRNPLSDDHTQLRTSLAPSLLEVLSRNKNESARLFEIGKIYIAQADGAQPQERRRIGLAMLDAPASQHWQKAETGLDFFALKGVCERLLRELGASPAHYRAASIEPFHPGRCASISIDGEDLGVLGEVHPAVRARYDLEHRAFLCVVDFDALVRHLALMRKYEPLPRFPAADRDLALVLDEDVSAAAMRATIARAAGTLLESATIFDIYRGAPVPENRKSVALALRFRAAERTLIDAEVDAAIKVILDAAQNELGAQLRE